MDEDMMIKLLVNGYIRQSNTSFDLNIPKALIDIIIKSYPRAWKFINRNYKYCTILNNGLTVSIKEETYVTVQFGEFFSNKRKMEYTFRFKTGSEAHNGIGFITKQFKDFERGNWNMGNNDSTVYYANGYC